MERKRSSGFLCIFTLDFDWRFRLVLVNVNDCHSELEPCAGARNRRMATVKIRRNPLLRFLSMLPHYKSYMKMKITTDDINKTVYM